MIAATSSRDAMTAWDDDPVVAAWPGLPRIDRDLAADV